MSVEAIAWALHQPIPHSTAKFVLVVLVNCTQGPEFIAWPSVAYLAQCTGQNRKTVLENLKRLRELDYIADTGRRKGDTGGVVVYRLNHPNFGTAYPEDSRPENGTFSPDETLKNREIQPVNPPKVEFISSSGPENGSASEVKADPKTGHGNVRNVKDSMVYVNPSETRDESNSV